jgi:hypothetical protein
LQFTAKNTFSSDRYLQKCIDNLTCQKKVKNVHVCKIYFLTLNLRDLFLGCLPESGTYIFSGTPNDWEDITKTSQGLLNYLVYVAFVILNAMETQDLGFRLTK